MDNRKIHEHSGQIRGAIYGQWYMIFPEPMTQEELTAARETWERFWDDNDTILILTEGKVLEEVP